MADNTVLEGVFAPVLTPFNPDLSVNRPAFLAFCSWLVGQGAKLAVFGTNSEANSMSLEERLDLLAALLEGGIPAAKLLPGVGACALPDVVAMSREAAKARCAGVLVLPPFYYKGVSDDGLYGFFAEAIERVGDQRLRMCLYHIPQVSGVPISLALIERLLKAYPETLAGIKDSGGNMEHTLTTIRNYPTLRVFAGSERFLTETLENGGAGCIAAGANINSAAIVNAALEFRKPGTRQRQARIDAVRDLIEGQPMIAALKCVIAHYGKAAGFSSVRPPLVKMESAAAGKLIEELDGLGFETPELADALSVKS